MFGKVFRIKSTASLGKHVAVEGILNIDSTLGGRLYFGTGGGKTVDAASSLSIYGGDTTGDSLVLYGSSADASQKITILGASGTTIIGNVVLGASGSETVTFTAKLGSQLYSNLTGTAYTILKIHNHATTAEIGGAEYKGELVNASGAVYGVYNTWNYSPTGLTGTSANVSAEINVMAITTGHTVTAGNIYGMEAHVQLAGTLNGAAVNAIGVNGVLSGAGANTLVLHMAGVASSMSTGLVNPTTGTLSYYLANSLSTVVVDNLICSLQSQYVTNFVSFDAVGGCIFANVAITAVNTAYALKINVAGTDAYIPVYTDLSWGS